MEHGVLCVGDDAGIVPYIVFAQIGRKAKKIQKNEAQRLENGKI